MRTLPMREVHREDDNCVRLVPIFSDLTAEQQDLVRAKARTVRLPRGEVLHVTGDRPGAVYVVHQGEVALSRMMPSGRSRLLRVVTTGDTVGEQAYLSRSATADESVALKDAQLCVFAHDDLDSLVREYPDIALQMMRNLSDRLTRAERGLALSSLGVDVRLADFLLQQPVRMRGTGEPGVPSIVLPHSKKDIASMLGTTPESLSRALARFADQELIRVDGDVVTLVDAQALEDRVDDA
ncbi:MAG TPA: Crp/Fnr family transcriptional regulator [Brevibacterium sp.]|nr:Crp/Fnr family transcriptional regulator [Brevibacterium sp.]